MRITPLSTTLPTLATTTDIFNSTLAFGPRQLRHLPLKRLAINLNNSQAGTARFYRSVDGGTTWTIFRSTAVAIPTANTINMLEQNIDVFDDVKVDWLNGGVTQTVFELELEGLEAGDERMPAVP